jgi:PAS domain S-box-containing protein
MLRCKDGTLKTVLIDSSVRSEDGEFLHSQCCTRDITEQRCAEEACRHLAAIVEGSDDAILSKSLEGVITSWNNAAERIFGYTAAEVMGRLVTLLIPPDRLTEEIEILSRLRRGERVDHYETVRRCKDGRLLNVSLTISPIMDGKGRIVGASKIARNITEKKRAEAALKSARDQLARMNEELERRVDERTASLRDAIAQLEEFSYTVSHDLRAPLRGMQVYSQALLEEHGATLDTEAQHCLARISENASRLDKMVLDVLTFSRVSRAEVRMERVRLDILVRDLIQQYPAMLPPRAIIEVARLHDVHGHEPSVTQVVSNMLSNAVKFVAPDVTPMIKVWTENNRDGVCLLVRDNGIGIKPDRQSRLFKMFERVHPGLPYEGTGVGLAIVRKAALRMGGEAGVRSDGSNGSTFWVQLPAAASA